MGKDKLEEIKNITPESSGVITTEAKDAGFHDFPDSDRRKFSFPRPRFGRKGLGGFGIAIAVIFLLLVVFGVLPAIGAYTSAKKMVSSAQDLEKAVGSQNIDQMRTSLVQIKKDLASFDSSLGRLSWATIVPFVGGYVKDAKAMGKGGLAGADAGEIILTTIEPYSDFLGLDGGKQEEDGAKTAEDRINFIVTTIGDIAPKLDSIGEKTAVLSQELNTIDPNRYPENFKGKPVRSQLRRIIDLVNTLHNFVSRGKPLLEQAPYLLGIGQERKYLFLFQNDKELRPTGGFITAYSIVKVKDGKFDQVSSNDIYNLDARLNSRIPAPEPIKKYLPLVNYWNLRDMNLSPDFKVSMDTFSENYKKTRSPEVDGIIAVDTKPLVDLLSVMGTIGVPGFGNFSAKDDPRCNCPQVIYELESFADVAGPIVWDDISGKIVFKPPHADNRKLILGPLMNSLIANAMGQPKEKLPDLFEAGWNALLEKHILLYLFNADAQRASEEFGLAGRIKDFDGDYLHINDSNFAGAKSNLYVDQEVDLTVEPGKDSATNVLSIRYKNPQKHDGWLNGPFRDWFRVYVPKGSELIDSTGSEVPVTFSEDLGKTVFEGFFTLRPEGVLEVKITYKTPVKKDGDYKILIQKQAGTEGSAYTVSVGGRREEFRLTQDKELRL
ncbi:MAG: DUF4012 domain-containing protein [bacterium]|nr:DUF4012 domain-containing protein [bacterium]